MAAELFRMGGTKLELPVPTAIQCYNFKGEDEASEVRDVIIVLINIFPPKKPDDTISLAYACNVGRNCHDKNCIYSSAGRR